MKNRTSLGDLDSAQNVDAKDAHYKTGTLDKIQDTVLQEEEKEEEEKDHSQIYPRSCLTQMSLHLLN